MNNLDKALALIECVFGQDGAPVTPSQASAATGINLATCARIITGLVEAGYLDKVSRHAGYIGGPLIFSLAGRPGPYHAVVENSRQALQTLATALGVTVNLAVLEKNHRRIILSATPPGGSKVPFRNHYDTFDDFYKSATGRLLLAQATPEERTAIVTRFGFPKDCWDGLDNMRALNNTLDALRRSRETAFFQPDYGIWLVGELIECPEWPAFAFGCSVMEDKKKAAIDGCRHAAMRIKTTVKQALVIA